MSGSYKVIVAAGGGLFVNLYPACPDLKVFMSSPPFASVSNPSVRFGDIEDRRIRAVRVPARVRRIYPEPVVRSWLRRICRELGLRLDAPLSVTQRGDKRIVTVLRVIEYTVDRAERSVSCRLRCAEVGVTPKQVSADLWRPLRSTDWLGWFMADMGLWPLRPRDLFLEVDLACRDWLGHAVLKLLRDDPRFQHLRAKLLRDALGLDAELFHIAMRARTDTLADPLPDVVYSRVWRNEKAFRQVAQENPHLLPLLHAFVEHSGLRSGKDPVQLLKAALAEQDGVSDAAWRYVCRHGARIFRAVWALTRDTFPFTSAGLYLRRLDQMGLPPPPPDDLLHAWSLEIHPYDLLYLETYWTPALCAIYRIGITEANRIKATPAFTDFLEEFVAITSWAEATGVALDQNQRRAGWSWLVRRWQEAHGWDSQQAGCPSRRWTTLVSEFEFGCFLVVPLTSDAELREEAWAMRNCIARHGSDALTDWVRLFSIRLRASQRRVADLELRHDAARGTWTVTQLAGFANRLVTEDVKLVGAEVARRYNNVQASLPPPKTYAYAPCTIELVQAQQDPEQTLDELGDVFRPAAGACSIRYCVPQAAQP